MDGEVTAACKPCAIEGLHRVVWMSIVMAEKVKEGERMNRGCGISSSITQLHSLSLIICAVHTNTNHPAIESATAIILEMRFIPLASSSSCVLIIALLAVVSTAPLVHADSALCHIQCNERQQACQYRCTTRCEHTNEQACVPTCVTVRRVEHTALHAYRWHSMDESSACTILI